MSSALCEEDVVITDNGTSLQTNTTSDTSTDVADNRTVEVWHDHDVELPGRFHELHGAIINDHLFILDERIHCCDFSGSFQEETIG